MKRVGGGVTWQLGGPPSTHMPHVIIAVYGYTVVIRHPDGAWKSGLYMNNEEAGKSATLMTERYEREGLHLIAGPAEFATGWNDPEPDTLHNAILTALGL